ncbi:HlyD family efflux transporter periplasmic adaptor subunit [Marinomonas sp. IMCC 4694]|uniref:HlyD family efflux transporter periplasmic adaptor subunit n=1 Tax=Marinomonas sp. IMCC 4694 TaxID=2605432 RepID=UPI0011E7BBCC|nr:HlyD family efflux transporter periplasmic adaptor subunit [Marinomonas sp. IMCC 4694]TYL48322.1 HlyD family efflux transporter periplasmic adaptor subunit [Marinomonas sp. IMCC 4694]
MGEKSAATLPKLRQNLTLLPASPDEDGEPRWQLFDPVKNAFFYLSRSAFYLFREWRYGDDPAAFLSRLEVRGVEIDHTELEYFLRFLEKNHLVESQADTDIARLSNEVSQSKKHLLMWLLHNYLFIKIPLVRPDLWLNRIYPFIKRLFNWRLDRVALLLGAVGLIMVLRQWDTFTHTFQDLFSFSVIGYYIAALVLVKTAHELGHAFAAKRYGCRVSSMGVAFLLMTPILYTDTTDAWRLRSRFQRLSIVTAGVKVEIYIACVATFLWSIVPDGGFRSVLFFVATTSWISSLLINTSPFMRFDGYYALSDFLGMENLQPRSFLVGKWFLRERLFGFGFLPPEPLNRKKCWLMVAYAWSTWVYRFFLFLGIAALVYYFAFKLLGIVLFLVEIIWFVVLPIAKEMKVWLGLRKKMSLNRVSVTSLLLLVVGLAVLVVPWKNHISAPAVATFERYQVLYPSESSRVVAWNMVANERVKKGQLLVLLESPEVEQEIELTQASLDSLATRWQRVSAGAIDLMTLSTLQSQLSREQSRLQSLLDRRERLAIKAPYDGYIGEWLSLSKGDYVKARSPLATLYDDQSGVVKAYVSGHVLARLQTQLPVRFISNDGVAFPVQLAVEKVLPTAIKRLHYTGLGSTYGGAISTQMMDDQLIPEEATYEVQLSLVGAAPMMRQQFGKVNLTVEPHSFLGDGLRRIYGVFIRESGF